MPRTDLAERIQEWVFPTALSRGGKLTRCIVPGHEARQYEVTLSREGTAIVCSCEERNTYVPCLGNGHSVCYHSLAAVMAAMRLQGIACEFHDNVPEVAKVIEVRSAACDKTVYVSVKEG